MTEENATDLLPIPLHSNAAELPHIFAAAFNTGNPDAIEAVYLDHGVLVDRPGHPTTGPARRNANAAMAHLGLPIVVTPRHVYETEDIALLIVDWHISGVNADGDRVNITGTATDVAQKDEAGCWRYVIDNPFGTDEAALTAA